MNTRVVDTKIRTYFNLGYFAKCGKQKPQTTCKQDHTFFLQTHFCKASGSKEALWPGSNWMVCSCFSHVQWKWWVRCVVVFKVLLRRTKFLIFGLLSGSKVESLDPGLILLLPTPTFIKGWPGAPRTNNIKHERSIGQSFAVSHEWNPYFLQWCLQIRHPRHERVPNN